MAYGPYGGVELKPAGVPARTNWRNPNVVPKLSPFTSAQSVYTPQNARDELAARAAFMTQPTTNPDTTNPNTTSGSSYGGSSRLSQAQLDAMRKAYLGGRPDAYTFDPFKYKKQQRPGFYAFDDSKFTAMKGGVRDAAKADLATGNAAYDEAAAQYANIPMAFQGAPTTRDPGMSAAMQRMFAANDVPLSINEQTINEGVQADDAFGNLFAILGANERQMATSRDLALGGDRRRLGETINDFARNAQLQIEMAQANALENHKKNEWAYGVETADRIYDQEMAVAMQNWQGQQQTNQANTGATNDWKGGWADILIGLIPELASGVNVPAL